MTRAHGNYTEPLVEYGHFMTVKDFRANVECGGFIDYDGYGVAVKDGLCEREYPGDRKMVDARIWPSTMDIPDDATHILWFNR